MVVSNVGDRTGDGHRAHRHRSGRLGGVSSEREVVLCEHRSLARESTAAHGAQAVAVGVLVQNHGCELVKSRSRISAADCSGGRLFTSTRSTSKPA